MAAATQTLPSIQSREHGLDGDSSNISSPLSDVEDKDGESHDAEIQTHDAHIPAHENGAGDEGAEKEEELEQVNKSFEEGRNGWPLCIRRMR